MASLAFWSRRGGHYETADQRNLRTVRDQYAECVKENQTLRAQLALCREKLGLTRVALAVETETTKEAAEHLRLMSLDNRRLAWECELWRAFYNKSDAPMPGINERGDER